MYLLDSDTVNIALRGQDRVTARLARVPSRDVFVSPISAEEILQGAMAQINHSRSIPNGNVSKPSFYFIRAVQKLADFQLLAYDDDAERLCRSLPASVKRVGGMDCRIAAHAMVSGFVVVTRNTQDFKRIPGVKIEDWSV